METLKHAWKEWVSPTIGAVSSCVCGATRRNKNDDLKECPRVGRRQMLRECEACFRLRICGQAFTQYTCKSCGSLEEHPNTCVPRICRACADKDRLCVRCGNSREPGERK